VHQRSRTYAFVQPLVGFRFRRRKAWGFKSLLVHHSESVEEDRRRDVDSRV